jgi:glycoprotein-N-acetylgalactosamine 3-beta-galactosyltransferase
MWSYIYDNYFDEYDWFHMGGDDMFLVVENLRQYLESEEIQTAQNGGIFLPNGTETTQYPLYLGKRYKWYGHAHGIYNSGGPGYTMNRAALKKLVVEGLPNVHPHEVRALEDKTIGEVFRAISVHAYDTKDDNGSERYMHFPPSFYYNFNVSKAPYPQFFIDPKEGIDHSSPKSIAFHYVKDDLMKRVYSLLYHPCPRLNETTITQQQ